MIIQEEEEEEEEVNEEIKRNKRSHGEILQWVLSKLHCKSISRFADKRLGGSIWLTFPFAVFTNYSPRKVMSTKLTSILFVVSSLTSTVSLKYFIWQKSYNKYK